MAKTLATMTKTFNKLEARFQECSLDQAKILTDYIKLKEQASVAAEQAGKDAAELCKKGHKGKVLADFAKDKPVKQALKFWAANEAQAAKRRDALSKSHAALLALGKDMQSIASELRADIEKRDKKANRKLLKIKSDSLPDLKKLMKKTETQFKQMQKLDKQMRDDLRDVLEIPFASGFEYFFDSFFKGSEKYRRADDMRVQAKGIVNLRAQSGKLRDAKKKHAELKKLCTHALKEAQAGNSPKAALDGASKALKEIRKMLKVQQQGLNTLSKDEKASADGKAFVKGLGELTALSKDGLKLLTSATRACFALQKKAQGA
ncbi:hypothetical protein [Ruegeria jejuensis]|uniref:hypothetical protein n=1 Tax=Ruegeria jejuensis TaxID=3233338 RepID=UPI00355C6D7C